MRELDDRLLPLRFLVRTREQGGGPAVATASRSSPRRSCPQGSGSYLTSRRVADRQRSAAGRAVRPGTSETTSSRPGTTARCRLSGTMPLAPLTGPGRRGRAGRRRQILAQPCHKLVHAERDLLHVHVGGGGCGQIGPLTGRDQEKPAVRELDDRLLPAADRRCAPRNEPWHDSGTASPPSPRRWSAHPVRPCRPSSREAGRPPTAGRRAGPAARGPRCRRASTRGPGQSCLRTLRAGAVKDRGRRALPRWNAPRLRPTALHCPPRSSRPG